MKRRTPVTQAQIRTALKKRRVPVAWVGEYGLFRFRGEEEHPKVGDKDEVLLPCLAMATILSGLL
jgi:hypothetical protein